jgi:hypothetical protein
MKQFTKEREREKKKERKKKQNNDQKNEKIKTQRPKKSRERATCLTSAFCDTLFIYSSFHRV